MVPEAAAFSRRCSCFLLCTLCNAAVATSAACSVSQHVYTKIAIISLTWQPTASTAWVVHMTGNVEACMLSMTCFLAMQNCVHGTSGLQRADQGVCFIPSAAHDSRSSVGQHHVYAKGKIASFTIRDAPAIWSKSCGLRQQNSDSWNVIPACVNGHAAHT